jgi:hypothetical protein
MAQQYQRPCPDCNDFFPTMALLRDHQVREHPVKLDAVGPGELPPEMRYLAGSAVEGGDYGERDSFWD